MLLCEALIGVMIYSIIATIWIVKPDTIIRWADYFAIKIKKPEDEDLRPIFYDEED